MSKWDSTFTTLVNARIFPDVIDKSLFFGISRAGKSTLGQTLFPTNYERVACHRDMTTDELIGGLSLVNGNTVWLDGPALRALRLGKLVIFDEIDQSSPECRPYFHALLDSPAAVTLPTGERINAAPGYCCIATTNELPHQLPMPIYDRFDGVYKVTELSDGLIQRLGDMAELAKASAAKEAKKYSGWSRPATINFWLAAAKLREHGMSDEQIADALGLDGVEKNDFILTIAKRREY